MAFSFNEFGNQGRLANQMFQYALLISLSEKHNTTFTVPPYESFGTKWGLEGHSNVVDAFGIDLPVGYGKYPTFKERFFHFDEEFFDLPHDKDLDIDGWFQSEKYFRDSAETVRKTFTFKSEWKNEAQQMRDCVEGELISLHIRRGDYVGNSAHTNLGMDYYSRALSMLPSDATVVIFTDDVEWVKSQPHFPDDRFLVSEASSDYVDMCLMTLCDYHIIANSSFSWWGAWLSNSKKVIAPLNWFSGNLTSNNTSDLYCNGWELV